MLARTPAVLRTLVGGADERWTDPTYGPGTWSAREIVAHLVFAEETDWIPRMRVILEAGTSRAFDPFDRDGHGGLAKSRSVAQLLDLFEARRAESLHTLASARLSDEDLQRMGRHPALGTVTLANLLATWTVHDLNHISQIAKAMAYQYKTEVGPWEAYLSVLAPPNPR